MKNKIQVYFQVIEGIRLRILLKLEFEEPSLSFESRSIEH
jgi:hypothetical protein